MTYKQFSTINANIMAQHKVDVYRIREFKAKEDKVITDRADKGVGPYHDIVIYRTHELISLVEHGYACISNVSKLANWRGFKGVNYAKMPSPIMYVVNIVLEDMDDTTTLLVGVFSTEQKAREGLKKAEKQWSDREYSTEVIPTLLDAIR